MSEDLSQAVPATTATSEAVPPVRAIDSDDPAVLRNKIELAKADREKAVAEKQSYKKQVDDLTRQIADLQNNQQKAKQNQLAEAGEYKQLWTDQSKTVSSQQDEIADLKRQLEDKDVAFQQQQIQNTANSVLTQAGVVNPDQAFSLLKENLRLKDGVPIALAGGVEVPLQQHLDSLRAPGSGWEHHFAGSGARGMSAVGSTSSSSGQKSWDALSFTEKLAIEQADIENGTSNAARLKAAG